MISIIVPRDRVELVYGNECAQWLLMNTRGSVIGNDAGDGTVVLHFSEQLEADAFTARWLDSGR